MRTELKHLRECKGYTQHGFADKLAIKKRTYEAYEQGRRNPGYNLMLKIMKELETSDFRIFKNYGA